MTDSRCDKESIDYKTFSNFTSYLYFNMKKYFVLFFLFFIFTFANAQNVNTINQRQNDSVKKARENEVLGKPLPYFLASGDNGVINNDSLKGKVIYVNMWSATCAPCMAEMDALNKLYDTLGNYPNFLFVSLSADNLESIRKIKERYNVKYPMYHLSEEGCYRLNAGMGYPTAIIIAANGKVTYIGSGGFLDKVKIWKHIFTDEIYPAIIKELQ